MKKILLLISSFALLFASCSKDFLDRKKVGELTEDDFFQTESDAEMAVTSGYSEIGHARWAQAKFHMGDMMTDDFITGGSQNDTKGFAPYKAFDIPSTNKFSGYVWTYNYRGINKTNQGIDGISEMTVDQISDENKNQFLGELYFLRALYYFRLVRAFGDVPLLLHKPTLDDMEITRTAKAEVYAQIETDLQNAASVLPKQGETEIGRATSGAALALAMRVNLQQGDFADIVTLGNDFMANESYTLETDLSKIFTEEGEWGPGSIFEVNYYDGSNQWSIFETNGNFNTPFQMPRGITWGWGNNLPKQKLADAYEAGDLRLDSYLLSEDKAIETEYSYKAEVGDPSDGNLWPDYIAAKEAYEADPTNDALKQAMEDAYALMQDEVDGFDFTGYYNGKFYLHPEGRTTVWSRAGNNTRVLRLADVYLMIAEAILEEGGTVGGNDAAHYLNLVRARAGVADIDATIPNVYNERRLELSGEGLGYWDLIRTGRTSEIPNFKSGFEVWPIPQSEIDLSNGSLIQNPY